MLPDLQKRGLEASEGAETPAIALTAYGRPEDRVRSISADNRHVVKPVNPAELSVVVHSLAHAEARAVSYGRNVRRGRPIPTIRDGVEPAIADRGLWLWRHVRAVGHAGDAELDLLQAAGLN